MRHFCCRSSRLRRSLTRVSRRGTSAGQFRPICGLGLFVLLLMAKAPLRGQDKPGISVDVKAVNVLATVRDKKGEIVTNLGQDDFKLEEDGRPQTITYFSREADLPLTLGLLVDTSFSQRRVLPEERGASQSFLDNMLREGQDQAFLIHFDRDVELLQDLTSSHQKLESALKLLQIAQPENDSGSGNGGGGGGYPGGGGGYPGGGYPGGGGGYPRGGGNPGGGGSPRRVRGGTALYDAIFLASDEVIKKQKGRKALIVLSDGVDRGSKETLERAIETAQKSDAIVYSILFVDGDAYGNDGFGRPGGGYPQRYPEGRSDGKKVLARISSETGGRMFEVSKKQSVDQIYRQIEVELRSQYSLGYTPDSSAGAGYHKLHLTTKQKDYIVQAREGYYLDR